MHPWPSISRGHTITCTSTWLQHAHIYILSTWSAAAHLYMIAACTPAYVPVQDCICTSTWLQHAHNHSLLYMIAWFSLSWATTRITSPQNHNSLIRGHPGPSRASFTIINLNGYLQYIHSSLWLVVYLLWSWQSIAVGQEMSILVNHALFIVRTTLTIFIHWATCCLTNGHDGYNSDARQKKEQQEKKE